MYLSVKSCHSLNSVVLDFEVAYRSFVSSVMIQNFSDENSFKLALDLLITKTHQTSVILTHRFSGKLNAQRKNYQNHYNVLKECYSAYLTKTVNDVDAPFVSVLNDYILIFYNDIFKNTDLIQGFSENDFMQYAYKYQKIRNDLFHPASSRILLTEAKDVIHFIRKVILNINESFFWYVPKTELTASIDNFIKNIEGNPISVHNLDETSFNFQKLVCRDNELELLKEYIFGKENTPYYRKAGSIVIYGYGGLGKTALVLELLNEIIKDSIDYNNPHNIDFLLFFTSKEEELTYSKTTGEVTIQELRKQINTFEDFQKNLFKYLSISNIENLEKFSKGIIVIDNLETLEETEKQKILAFIQSSPSNIHYVLTSRYEEKGAERLHLEGFSDIDKGKEFLKQYQIEYNIDLKVDDSHLETLVKASKGNTLILVLSLQQLNDNRLVAKVITS